MGEPGGDDDADQKTDATWIDGPVLKKIDTAPFATYTDHVNPVYVSVAGGPVSIAWASEYRHKKRPWVTDDANPNCPTVAALQRGGFGICVRPAIGHPTRETHRYHVTSQENDVKRLVIALALALTTGTMAGCTQSGPDLAKSKDKSSDQADTGQTQAGTISPGIAQAGRKTENELILTLKTGKVVIKLLPNLAPKHVARIKRLARKGFYNGIVFHRVIAGFMAQTGDPTGTGRGGSKLPDLPAEFSKYVFKRGTVGAARSASPNSANSQFFICFGSGCAGLTGQYTVWGQVIKGMENVDKIKLGEPPRNPDKMISLQVAADVKQ